MTTPATPSSAPGDNGQTALDSERRLRSDVPPPPGPAVLKLERLGKSYGDVNALGAVDLAVMPGEFITILGPSGSGKTTLLKLIAGFELPSRGQIELRGRNISSLPPARREIGMVFQQYALFPHLTVLQNVAYGLRMRGWSKDAQRARAEEVLGIVRLEGYGARYPRQLSGGQQQRVALGRAFAYNPAVLLMDEPLGALDRELRFEMAEEIRRLHRSLGTTTLYVTHDREEALYLADRIVIMRHGGIVDDGTPYDLFHLPRDPFVASFFGGHNVTAATSEAAPSAGRVTVRWEGIDLDAICVSSLGPGPIRLVIPHRSVRRAGERDAAARATVAEVLFLGGTYRVSFRLASGADIVGEFDDSTDWRLALGDELRLTLDPSHLVAVSDTTDSEREDAP